MNAAAVGIAATALVLSVTTFFITRQRDKRDLFLRVHERLASIEQQRGRKLIHDMKRDHKRVEDLDVEQFEAINNALSILNVACLYYVRRYVSRKDMLRTWCVPIVRAFDAAAPFLAYRAEQVGARVWWPELHQFAADGRDYVRRHGREGELADQPSN